MSELRSTQGASEKAEELLAEVSFALKFKKMKSDKSPLTVTSAKELVMRAAGVLTELLDTSKALKALVPPRPAATT